MTNPVASLSLPSRQSVATGAMRFAGAVGRAWPALAALFVAGLLPLCVRLLIVAEHGYAFDGHDGWGAQCDVGTGIAAAALLVLAFRASRVLGLVLGLLWLGLNAGYYEFFHQYESPYFLIYAGFALDPTFVEGSGIHLTRPLLTAAAAALFLSLAAFAGRHRPAIPAAALAGIAAAGTLFAAMQPWSQFVSPWRQRNFVSLNVADVATRAIWPDTLDEDLAANRQLIADYLKPDLSGTPILAASRPRTNVVLIFIEGVPGGHLASLAAAQHTDADLDMPLLDRWARDNLSFSSFITHQRQSDRGIYAALCGDLPRLMVGVPKMSVIADSRLWERKCLPQALADHGYNSLFLHAANGGFMEMDRFSRKIGFQRELASEDFDPKIPRGPWGIDDASLYDAALKEIDALAHRDKPFFVTMFTTSTHHPYGIPDSFTELPDASRDRRARAFADHAVDGFLAALEARGRLDDTLVLVTSDEANQVNRLKPGMPGMLIGLTENWGYMVAVTPERLKLRVDRAFQQADIPLSVLDYLGFDEDAGNFIGRSFFRSYEAGRTIYSANVYKRRIQEYVEGKGLTICDASLTGCQGFDTSRAPLFSYDTAPIDGPATPSRLMRAIRAYSVTSPIRPPVFAGG